MIATLFTNLLRAFMLAILMVISISFTLLLLTGAVSIIALIYYKIVG